MTTTATTTTGTNLSWIEMMKTNPNQINPNLISHLLPTITDSSARSWWNDPGANFSNYCEVREDLQVGRQPRQTVSRYTLDEVCNTYLTRSKERQDSGETASRTFEDYHDTYRVLVDHFEKTVGSTLIEPTEFGQKHAILANEYFPSRPSKMVSVTRMVLNRAYQSDRECFH